MTAYKSLIVEDVKDTSDYIMQRVQKLCSVIETTDQAFNLDNAYELILKNNYDIVFLDIQMPKGTSFDLLKRLSENSKIDFEIIFITGESAKEYTLNAIKYSALDYLYKPLDDSELVLAVRKATERLSNKKHNKQIQILLEHFSNTEQQISKKIAFHLRNGIVELLRISDILYLQADGNICHIFLTNDSKLTTNKNLGYYKDLLTNDFSFKQISNSLLVNPEYIKRYNYSELTLTLTNGVHLYASKRYGKILKDSLSKNSSGGKIKNLLNLLKG